ncbi:phage minor tail protein L [Salmonella enterica]|uniref:Phage minor tail protein L n=1 Tax=Salmonella enterica subsp. salamae TaxID=59202 RepID=A0A5Y3MRZ2_SALER|nr:phage minor tail protein L [Salmonella enterica]EAA7086781.1 phage minor tail protein L [Salmonella enterica subsp. enterica serovar Veneziana]ECD4177151.1 phage minor tail protein L [Salmonella enterica subsp. enterica serovar Napoli]ECI4010058.1 phage minor tail protein L [Salmonella enterica subsp. salamae]EDW8759143.1 phage minor tail protein L [Salmonella enterica subsp. enterica]EEJ8617267.1 phage minor tail protein L [Salmonella enterica subsp. enterica serovar Veneziana]
MRDIPQNTLNETTQTEQSARPDLWEFDLTTIGGERYFFCNEPNERGEPVTWQGRQYEPYPIQAQDFEMNGKGPSPRVTLVVSNLFGMVTGIAEDLQSLVGASVVRRQVYSKFLDAVNFSNGNPGADPEQEAVARYKVEQLSELDSSTATIILASPAETDGSVVPGRIMLAEICTFGYRGEECGYHGPPVADEFDNPTTDPAKDKCSHCMKGCTMRNNVRRAGFFASINKLS